MIHFPVYVNDRAIAQLRITRVTNTEEVDPADQVSKYQVEVDQFGRDAGHIDHQYWCSFTIEHRYGDGVWVLISKALSHYNEEHGEM